MNAPADPRPLYRTATTWVTGLMTAVTSDQFALPTSCSEFDVAELMGHLIGTARRGRALGGGEDIFAVSMTCDDPTAGEYAQLVGEAIERWQDDATLTALVTVPWGQVPGAGALWGYVNETLVHGWDLAVATGQPAECDPVAADATLAVVRRFITLDGRDEMPFDEAVTPRLDAGPTERLANWSGRQSVPWLVAG